MSPYGITRPQRSKINNGISLSRMSSTRKRNDKVTLGHRNIFSTWASYHIRKLRVAHAPGMPGMFSPQPWVSDPGMHQDMCVPWCRPGSLTSCFLWTRWRGKRSQHSRCMHNPQFYVSGKRPIAESCVLWIHVAITRGFQPFTGTFCNQSPNPLSERCQ